MVENKYIELSDWLEGGVETDYYEPSHLTTVAVGDTVFVSKGDDDTYNVILLKRDGTVIDYKYTPTPQEQARLALYSGNVKAVRIL